MTSNYEAITRYNEDQLGKDTSSRKSQVNMYSDFSHFVFEILQNADDYGATSITFELSQDKLSIEHNGIPFTEENVKAISYFGKGTSRDDLIKTGQFGLGFKSVFSFTATPIIHSGEENFKIYDLYHLKALTPPDNLEPEKTKIYLPFNHEEEQPDFVETLVSKQKAYDKISHRLKKLDITTLLFTQNLLEIKWSIQGEEGHYLREDKVEEKINNNFTERETTITDGNTLHSYLVFSKPIEWHENEYKSVEVAFFLDEPDKSNQKAKSIQAIRKSLIVLFPTTQETKIGFLINGPFRTPAHRETVSQDDEFNQFLIKNVATLVCEVLPRIREIGLLAVSFLKTLPIKIDDFPEDGMLYPIFTAVRDTLLEQELLLADDGSFVSAQNSKLASAEWLRTLLQDEHLKQLFKTEQNLKWISSKITERATHDLWKYIKDELKIEEVTPGGFVRKIEGPFLEKQTDDWMVSFYTQLAGQKALWKKSSNSYWDKPGILRSQQFIRLQNGSHVRPFKNNGLANVFLPPENETEFSVVKRDIAKNKKALDFLKELGLTKPDAVDEVIDRIIPKYTQYPPDISYDEHMRDMKKILRAYSTDSQKKKSLLTDRLKNTAFIRAENLVLEQIEHKKPAEQLYFKNEELLLYFDGNKDTWFICSEYDECFYNLFKDLGINGVVSVKREMFDCKRHVIIANSHSCHRRGLNGFDPNIKIDGLEHALNNPTIKKSEFIWNKIVLPNAECICGTVESSSRQTYEGNRKKERISESFGQLLMDTLWLPDKQGSFHKPAKRKLDDLPELFVRDEKLVKPLDMEKDIVARLAEEAGISQDAINIAKELEKHPELLKEFIEKVQPVVSDKESTDTDKICYKDELQKSFNRPGETELQEQVIDTGKVEHPDRHREKSYEGHKERLDHEPKPDERRRETVRTILEGPNEQVREYLSQFYDGKCQICGRTFSERNGKPFFIANYIVPKKRARFVDDPANALCLCANHFAKWQHGAVEADNILDQIKKFKTETEGGDGEPALKIKLCGEECTIKIKEKHILKLQELLRASENQNEDAL